MYQLVIGSSAKKAIRKLPKSVAKRMITAIYSLKENPRPAGCIKLSGKKDLWRIRVGDYRVLYTVDDVVRLVEIAEAGHRKDIYNT